ncbi:D-alanyl-D-alanine carboxypeptidase (penicillin-binding protein 5/6) [Natronincola peptidivorans]|uniref:serine-type D-Ala-D-Ala carboxypeptidase n=1 Tax=Natronincola peptidivorans TaxID=426128 RepID=A0A1H9YY53_9FIRM|nr:D-alanyl-D-alanine carboxypeptidase family protein [Natronincola peptidivorans]SES74146.1 D-alanyl-D-alanine carboxypeptidase (penicillin-binding protein 5/6) [Natronincola peptidivorans]
MTKKNSIFTMIFVLIILAVSNIVVYASPTLSAPNAVLIDSITGKVLFDHNAHTITYPASTTKVMTAILVLENVDLDEVITKTDNNYVIGSSMYLLEGESFTVEELLQSLMIRSANDAAELLAIHISGSVEDFALLMNSRAKELGALNTHFTNPHGLPDENHVTTAYDLAMITRHAMTFDVFREIVTTTMLIFEPTEFTPETRYFRNTNRFLWGTGAGNQILYNGAYTNIQYDIIDGVKTGYTPAAQNCLISSATKEDHQLISVVLGAQGLNVYTDSRSLIDYGYNNYQFVQLSQYDDLITTIPLKNGIEDSVPLYVGNQLDVVISRDINISEINDEIIINENLEAPILSGDTLGKIVYSVDEELIGEVQLVAKNNIDTKPLLRKLIVPSNLFLTLIILFLLWQAFIISLRIKKRRKKSTYWGGTSTSYTFNKNLLKTNIYKKK